MVWVYIIAAVVIFLLLKELIRLPTVGKYGERYVFITGCDTGFGNALAKLLDSLGFNVFAGCYTERGEDELKKVASARLTTVSLDVTKVESIRKARETVEKQLPSNKGKEKGRIVNMTSMAGRLAFACTAYCISKYGVEAFSDCLRREVLKQGITVHIIEPSSFKTEITIYDEWFRQMDMSYNEASKEAQQYYGKDYIEAVKTLFTELFRRSMCTKLDLVVDAYTHAITAMFPRPRYVVGPGKYLWILMVNLPEWISDRLFSKYVPIPDGAK